MKTQLLNYPIHMAGGGCLQMRKTFLFFFCVSIFLLSNHILAQRSISGTVVDEKYDHPLSRVGVFVQGVNKSTTTDENGKFQLIFEKAQKTVLIQFSKTGYISLHLLIDTNTETTQLGIVELSHDLVSLSQDISVIADLDVESQDGELSQRYVGILSASKDPFNKMVAFQFSNVFFRSRGLDGKHSDTYINGIRINKFATGRAHWTNWGGLNNVTNNQIHTNAETPSSFGLGAVNGTTSISMKPSQYRPGLRLSASLANQNSYKNRLMATCSSDLLKNGWAFSLSSSLRYAKQGCIQGTSYNAISGYLGIQKKIHT